LAAGSRDGSNARGLFSTFADRDMPGRNGGGGDRGDVIVKFSNNRERKLDVVRAACSIVGEMGDAFRDRAAQHLEGKPSTASWRLAGAGRVGPAGRMSSLSPSWAISSVGGASKSWRSPIARHDLLGAAGSWCNPALVEIGPKASSPTLNFRARSSQRQHRRVYAAPGVVRLLEPPPPTPPPPPGLSIHLRLLILFSCVLLWHSTALATENSYHA